MEIVVGFIFLLAGLAILLGAFLLVCHSIRRLRSWNATTGKVIDYIETVRSKNQRSYLPKVQFLSPGGRSIVFTNNTSSNRKPHQIGGEVKVIYDPEDIQNAGIKSFSNLWLLPCFAVFFGGIFSTLGVNLLFFTKH